MINTLRVFFYNTLRSESGNVAIMVAVSLLALVLGAGASVDMARAQILQTKIQSALDASGLAATATMNSVPVGTTQAEWTQAQAQRYFNANFPKNYLGTDPITISATPTSDGTSVVLNATTTQATSFMKIVGIDKVNVSASSAVSRTLSGQGMELVLALDNTGSMNCNVVSSAAVCDGGANTKIAALKSAAQTLLDILYGSENDTAPNLFVGVVPFSQTVNVGLSHVNWFDTAIATGAVRATQYDWGPGNSWGGCITERPFSNLDYPPNTQPGFGFYYYPPEPSTTQADALSHVAVYGYYWNYNPEPPDSTPQVWPINGWKYTDSSNQTVYLSPLDTIHQGPNLYCPQPITPLVSSKKTVLDAVNSMVPTGDTFIMEGMAWSWRLLSPYWRGYWGGEMNANNLPLDYDNTSSRKVVVLISDGRNHFLPYNYTAFNWLWSQFSTYTEAQGEATADARTKYACDSMKKAGVIVYTVGFGINNNNPNDPSSVNYDLLQYCATDADHFYPAPTDDELKKAFTQIGNSLANLRVSQ